jgi:O-antigen biosynthesis protein
MSFTGERYIPGEGGCQIAYEHLHRYFFALRWAEGCEILDLACGNGYGAALLARRARHVCALDIDGETIAVARKNWCNPNLTFMQGDATRLPFRSGTIDLVVAMEALEHIKDQTQLLQELARVCSTNGVALISTPNKAEYSDARKYDNPFHIRELYLDEFVNLLKQHFQCVEIAGQQIRAGSLISCNPTEFSCEIFEEAACGEESTSAEPMYYLAVCSRDKLRKEVPSRSAYLDSTDGLILEAKREIGRLNKEILALGEWGKSLERVIGERDQAIRDLQSKMKQELDSRDKAIWDLQNRLAQEVDLRDRAIQDLQNELVEKVDSRDQAIRDLQKELHAEIAGRDQRINDLLNLLHEKEREFDDRGKWALSLQAEVERLTQIHQAFLYRILSRLGLLPK